MRYGQAPNLFTAPERDAMLVAVISSLKFSGGHRLAAGAGECLGYLLESLGRLAKAPPPGEMETPNS